MPRISLIALCLVVFGSIGLYGCASKSPPKGLTLTPRLEYSIPGPSGLVAIGQPQPNGAIWALSQNGAVTDIHQLQLNGGELVNTVGVNSSTTDIAESSSGELATSLGSGQTGSIELRNGQNGKKISIIPMSGPVLAVTPGANGYTYYGLTGTQIGLVNAVTHSVTQIIPAPTGAIDLVSSPSQNALWILSQGGSLTRLTIGQSSGAVLATIESGALSAKAIAINPTGSTIYVLDETATTSDIVAISTSTGQIAHIYPGPPGNIDIALSPDGTTLYEAIDFGGASRIDAYGPLPPGA